MNSSVSSFSFSPITVIFPPLSCQPIPLNSLIFRLMNFVGSIMPRYSRILKPRNNGFQRKTKCSIELINDCGRSLWFNNLRILIARILPANRATIPRWEETMSLEMGFWTKAEDSDNSQWNINRIEHYKHQVLSSVGGP